MGRQTHRVRRKQPVSKMARRRKMRRGRGLKTEAELMHLKRVRDAARRKRRRAEAAAT